MNKTNKFHPRYANAPFAWCRSIEASIPLFGLLLNRLPQKIGCVPQTLLEWIKREEADAGVLGELSTIERERLKAQDNELRRANDILKTANAFSAQAELDRRLKS